MSAKVGSAAVRNRVKRQLREIFRKKADHILGPGFFMLIARKSINKARFVELESDFLDVIMRMSERRN